MTTTPNPDLHIVIAALECQGHFIGYTAVSAPLPYDEALKVWERNENTRGLRRPGDNRRGHVRHYAVRSLADPQFAPLVGKGFADSVNKQGHLGRERGIEKAAKAWAKDFGYTGKAGGWIYRPNGETVTQGWFNFAQICKRAGRIAQGSDGLWYVLDREVQA